MTAITVNTANGPRTLTAAANEYWNRWTAVAEMALIVPQLATAAHAGYGWISTDPTILSTDHPMIRHSPEPLPWAHPGTDKLCFPTAGVSRYCQTWGEYSDALGQPPSPDHYFVGVNP